MAYETDRAYVAWFEYAEPGLVTNRTIRNFLGEYNTNLWPQLVKLTLIYGIKCLEKKMDKGEQKNMTIEEIKTEVRNLEISDKIDDYLPDLKKSMNCLRNDIDEILEIFDFNPVSNDKLNKTKKQDINFEKNGTNKNEVKSKELVLLDVDKKEEVDKIYPNWWGDGSHEENTDNKKEKRKQEERKISIPRLSYTIMNDMYKNDILKDDMVTGEYLNVKSSGYGEFKNSINNNCTFKNQFNSMNNSNLIGNENRCSEKHNWFSTILNDEGYQNSYNQSKYKNEEMSTDSEKDEKISLIDGFVDFNKKSNLSDNNSDYLSDVSSTKNRFKNDLEKESSSGMFWVDFNKEDKKSNSSFKSERKGYVMDFGHLDSLGESNQCKLSNSEIYIKEKDTFHSYDNDSCFSDSPNSEIYS